MSAQELAERYRFLALPTDCARLRAALSAQLDEAGFAPEFARWPDLAEMLLDGDFITAVSGAARAAQDVQAQFADLGVAHVEHAAWYRQAWPEVVAGDLAYILVVFYGVEAEDLAERRTALAQAIKKLISRPAGFVIMRSVARPVRTWSQNEALVLEGRGLTADRIPAIGARWRRRLAQATLPAWKLAGGVGDPPPVHVSAGLRSLAASNFASRGTYIGEHIYLQLRPVIMARFARNHRRPDMDGLTDEAFMFEPCLSDPFGRPSPVLTLLHEMIHAATNEMRSPEPEARDAAMIKASPAFAEACGRVEAEIQGLAFYDANAHRGTRSKVVFREVLTQLAALELEPALRAQTPSVSWPAIDELKDVNGYGDGVRLMVPLLAKARIGALELLRHREPWPVLLKAASDLAGPAAAEAMIADALTPLEGSPGPDLGWLAYDFGRRHSLEPPDLALDLARIEN